MKIQIQYIGTNWINESGQLIEEKRPIGSTLSIKNYSGYFDEVSLELLPENFILMCFTENTLDIFNDKNTISLSNKYQKTYAITSTDNIIFDLSNELSASIKNKYSDTHEVKIYNSDKRSDNFKNVNINILLASIGAVLDLISPINTQINKEPEALKIKNDEQKQTKTLSSKKQGSRKNKITTEIADEDKLAQISNEFSKDLNNDESWVTMKKFQIKPTTVKDLTNKFFSTLKKVNLDELFKSEIIDDNLKIDTTAFISDITKTKADSILHDSGINLYISAKMDESTLRKKWNQLQDISTKQSNFKISD